jgi:hypothetical protein
LFLLFFFEDAEGFAGKIDVNIQTSLIPIPQS